MVKAIEPFTIALEQTLAQADHSNLVLSKSEVTKRSKKEFKYQNWKNSRKSQ